MTAGIWQVNEPANKVKRIKLLWFNWGSNNKGDKSDNEPKDDGKGDGKLPNNPLKPHTGNAIMDALVYKSPKPETDNPVQPHTGNAIWDAITYKDPNNGDGDKDEKEEGGDKDEKT